METDQLTQKRIVQVRQRVSTVVTVDEMVPHEGPPPTGTTISPDDPTLWRREIVLDQVDRPIQLPYDR